MNQYMALTSNDSATPALFVDTTVPLEILLDAATYRLRAVTQVLENLALRGEISSDAVVLSVLCLAMFNSVARRVRLIGCNRAAYGYPQQVSRYR